MTTRVGGNAEIVREGIDGHLVPYGDVPALAAALGHALDRPWDRAAMVAHAHRHDWEQARAEVLEEFERAARPSSPVAESPVSALREPRA